MSITRFDKDMDGSMEHADDGPWVRFDSHEEEVAALKEQAALLTAGNARLDEDWRGVTARKIGELEATISQQQAKIDKLVGALEYFFPDWKKYGHLHWKYKAAEALAAIKGEK